MSLQNPDKNVRKIDIHHRAVAWATVCQCAGLPPASVMDGPHTQGKAH